MSDKNNSNPYAQISAKEDYDKLLTSGMFFEFHPELTGVWEKDCQYFHSDTAKAKDPIEEEKELVRRTFNLAELLVFQTLNDVQIIRGGDYQYLCYVNNKVYASGLTPMYALVHGIRCFKSIEKWKE